MTFNSSQEKLIFFYFPVILFSLLPAFLITGPFLSDLSISLISLLFLFYCFKKKNFSYFKNKYFFFFLIFCVYLIFNSLINNINFNSLKISFFFIRYGVFVIAIVTLLNFNNNFVKYFFYCILLCFVILVIDGFYQYFHPSEENLFGYGSGSKGRISSFFGDELILGSYISRIWPLFFCLSLYYLNTKNKLHFYLFSFLFILTEVLIFLSGDRAAFFYITLSTIFIILFSNKLFKLRITILIFSLLIIIAISFFNPTAKERVIDQTLKQMNLTNGLKIKNQDVVIFSEKHQQHYISALKMYLDNKILGVGVKNFRNFCDKEKYKTEFSCNTHPHNTYLQILTETGIIGFLFLIFILFYFIFYLLKHLILKIKGKPFFSDYKICLISGILIYLWPFIPTGNVFNNWLNIIIAIYCPFLLYGKSLRKESRHRGQKKYI
jgi:O-antigen ligase